MSDIINFREKAKEIEPCVWQCLCGNCSFMLYENGRIQCSKCDEYQISDPHSVVVKRWTRKEDGELPDADE